MIQNWISQISQALVIATSTTDTTGLTMSDVGIKLAFGVILGFCISVAYIICNKDNYSRNFALSMILLPSLVAAVIWFIGSDITRAISLGGIFSLIKFRSVPGDSKDITEVFITMVAGLAIGLGYYEAAVLVTVVAVAVLIVFTYSPYAKKKDDEQQLRITVPESLDFQDVFDEVLKEYTSTYSLDHIKTTHMGTLFELTYHVKMKDESQTKAFMDELRTRNGNLSVSIARSTQDKITAVL